MAEHEVVKNTLELATELTIAWVSNPNVHADAADVPSFLQRIHQTLATLSPIDDDLTIISPQHDVVPAVPIDASLRSPNHIISLIDGKPYRTLRRHLAAHGLTPEQYRERYNLPRDYPIVAETYSIRRRELAKQIGLGGRTNGNGKVAGKRTPIRSKSDDLKFAPAVSVRKSLGSSDHILSMIDGKPYKMLRRHLNVHGLTPDEYRTRYNLPADYPMVAESFSKRRRELAKETGLGRKPKKRSRTLPKK